MLTIPRRTVGGFNDLMPVKHALPGTTTDMMAAVVIIVENVILA